MPAISFKAKISTIGSWTILRVPKNESAKLPSRGPVMVAGVVNNVGFQTPLEPDGNDGHWFKIGKELQKTAHAGDTVKVAMEPTKIWPEPHVPADVKKALDAHPKAKKQWLSVTPLARHEWIRWIGATGRLETRERHIEVACSKLMAGERRPCCFNRNACCVPEVSKNGVLIGALER